MRRHIPTPEYLEELALKKIERFCLCSIIFGGMGFLTTVFVWGRSFSIIFIQSVKAGDREGELEQVRTFIVCLIHASHLALGLPENNRTIQRKAAKFFEQHNEFSKQLFTKVKKGEKFEGKNWRGKNEMEKGTETENGAHARILEELKREYGKKRNK